jgi:hypothetical protein
LLGNDQAPCKNQIEFVNPIINELADRVAVMASWVYESPYDGVATGGPEAIFVADDLDRIFAALDRLRVAVL